MACADGPASASPMLRLTRAQYDNLAKDLLAASTSPSSILGTDEKVGPFAVNGVSLMSRGLAEQYQQVAEQLASELEPRASQLAPCATGAQPRACAATFLGREGPRYFRRALRDDEMERYLALFDSVSGAGGYPAGISALVEAMLQSPAFLYRLELLPAGVAADTSAAWALDADALATRLSFFLWNSGPDDALRSAAAAGSLGTAQGLTAQVEAMMEDPRFARSLEAFTDAWAGLDSLVVAANAPAGARGLTVEQLKGLHAETLRFVGQVLVKGDGRLETLMTAPYTYADATVAGLYGTALPDSSGRLSLDPTQRAGLLTQASVLFAHSHAEQTSPVLRGKWVREVLLCQKVPDPPADVKATPPDPVPGQSTRERFAAHRNDPSCAGCHALLDDIGFGFEGHDEAGRFRTVEPNGSSVITTGNLSGTDVDGPFDGVPALARKLSASAQPSACFATQTFRFALGRNGGATETCLLADMASAVRDGDGYRALVKRLVTSPAFAQRRSP